MAVTKNCLQMLGLLGALAIGAVLPAKADDGIQVVMNQAKIVKLARAADTIVVGNPNIADAAVQDSTTIVLTGKGFGVTNLVVLDAEGTPIVDEQITVARQTASSLRIYRRADIQTLSCTPFCESSYKSDAERTSEAETSAAQ
ncbi:pilus assembly protein N-terminal domain-containing protein [Mesorhizobium sp. CN2-181]